MPDFPAPLMPLDKLRLLTKTHPKMFLRSSGEHRTSAVILAAEPDLSYADRSEVAKLITYIFPRATKYAPGIYGLGPASTRRLFEQIGTRARTDLNEHMRQEIVSRYHQIGYRSKPSIRTLAAEFNVSRATIHRLIRDTDRIEAAKARHDELSKGF